MQNLMFPWKQKSNLLSGEETEILKAEQDSFEWKIRRRETLCTKNGNEIYVISIKEIKDNKRLDNLTYHMEHRPLHMKNLRMYLLAISTI